MGIMRKSAPAFPRLPAKPSGGIPQRSSPGPTQKMPAALHKPQPCAPELSEEPAVYVPSRFDHTNSHSPSQVIEPESQLQGAAVSPQRYIPLSFKVSVLVRTG